MQILRRFFLTISGLLFSIAMLTFCSMAVSAETSATLKQGEQVNSILNSIDTSGKDIERIIFLPSGDYLTDAGTDLTTFFTSGVDYYIDDGNGIPVCLYFEDKTLYVFSEADKIIFHSDSSWFFYAPSTVSSIKKVQEIVLSDKIDTSQVTDMNSMFYGCSNLKLLDISGISIKSGCNVNNFFTNCTSLIWVKSPSNIEVPIELPGAYDFIIDDNGDVIDDDNSLHGTLKTATTSHIYYRADTLTSHPFEILETIKDQTYTGNEITPSVSVVKNFSKLTENTDYTLSYSDNINVGMATITATGIGSYAGETATKYFNIVPKALPDSFDFEGSLDEFDYNGDEHTPTVSVKDGTKTLVKNTDFTVSYTNNINPGTATITVTGIGNYKETRTRTFLIKNNLKFEISAVDDQTYSGSAIKPAIRVVDRSNILNEGENYTVTYSNNINAGTATVTATGTGIYSGLSDVATFTINPKSLPSTFYFEGQGSSFEYTGSAITPNVTVVDGNNTLKKDIDYSVSYSNNTNSGTATITVTGSANNGGSGNYTGTVSGTFTIVNNLELVISPISDQTYTGSAIVPNIVVTDRGKALTKGTHYSLSITNNINSGTAHVVATGLGIYNGLSSETDFIINPKALPSGFSFEGQGSSFEYTGSAITPAVTVVDGSTTLKKDKDYTVSYSDNTNPGTATITVQGTANNGGKGNYIGTISATFTISSLEFIISPILDQTYTGTAITPDIIVTNNGNVLTNGTHYSLTITNNINVGTARVIAKGIGLYNGLSDEATFVISPKSLPSSFSFYGQGNSFDYTGSAIAPSVTVKDGDSVLRKDTDYTVAYQNNVNPGLATITVTGKGNYSGTINEYFEINEVQDPYNDTLNAPSNLVFQDDGKIVFSTNNSGKIGIYYNVMLTPPQGKKQYFTLGNVSSAICDKLNAAYTMDYSGNYSVVVKATVNAYDYDFTVGAVSPYVNSAFYPSGKLMTPSPAQFAPGRPTVTWNAISGAASYTCKVYAKKNGVTFGMKNLISISGPAVNLTSAVTELLNQYPNADITFSVRAISNNLKTNANSDWSSEVLYSQTADRVDAAPNNETNADYAAKVGETVCIDHNYYVINDSDTVTFKSTDSSAKKLTIPDTISIDNKIYTVTAIAENALKNNTKVKSVKIANTITSIGKRAFYKCKNLKDITINGNTLKSVGKNAFKGISKKATFKIISKNKKVYKKAKNKISRKGSPKTAKYKRKKG